MAPLTVTETTVITENNAEGIPVIDYGAERVPVGTPGPTTLSGTALLVVLVAEFETPSHADGAFDRFDRAYRELFRRDPRTPEMTDLGLEGIRDRAGPRNARVRSARARERSRRAVAASGSRACRAP